MASLTPTYQLDRTGNAHSYIMQHSCLYDEWHVYYDHARGPLTCTPVTYRVVNVVTRNRGRVLVAVWT